MSNEGVIEITSEIKLIVKEIREVKNSLRFLAQEKADSLRNYRKELAKKMMQLKSGKEIFELDGIKTPEKTSVTLIPDIAKGLIYQEVYARDLSDARYKAAITSLQALTTIVNALQSILRRQDEY